MRKFFLFFFLFSVFLSLAQTTYTISGYVTDLKTGETLINASVYDVSSGKGSVSNTFGFYSLTLPAGKIDLRCSYIGYEMLDSSFVLSRDMVLHLALTENNTLDEVTVVGHTRELGVQGSQMSAIEVSVAQLKAVPALFGETDVIKALQLLPGVQSGTEGSAGFYVRGGGPDENLFLLDGVPVYNVNHMGGFFSVFNADAIKSVTLYKGGFPARFGGRLSSVLDVHMNDGNNEKVHGNVSIGLISAKLNLEGPLFNKNTTFSVSARRTYFDLLARPVLKLIGKSDDRERLMGGYYFYDLNAKVTHRFSDKDRLYLSFFMGDDGTYTKIKETKGITTEKTTMDWDWGNIVSSLRWNHMISNKLFMNTQASYTRYRFNMDMGYSEERIPDDPAGYRFSSVNVGYKSSIEDLTAKVDFDFIPNPNHDIKFGTGYIYHSFRPGVSSNQLQQKEADQSYVTDTVVANQNIYAHETATYIEDNIRMGKLVKANIGLHYSTYYVQQQFYHSLQPRVSMRVSLTDKLSLKAAYAYMNQYIHLLSSTNISLPTDLWVPVTKRIEPMQSHQVALGIFYNLKGIIDFSVEGYYKGMNNLIEYKDGANFLGSNSGWEDKVNSGRGWAYGIEFLAQKTVGKTTGWIAYTWSKAERLFDRPGEEINHGEVFPAKYDRRHDISLVISHKFNEKIDVSGTWVYSSGNWGTLGLQDYYTYEMYRNKHMGYRENTLTYIDRRNNFQYPAYHRLDLGVNFHKQKKRGIRTWSVSIYNVYNRMNPFIIYQADKSLRQVTLFPILPSVSYSFKF